MHVDMSVSSTVEIFWLRCIHCLLWLGVGHGQWVDFWLGVGCGRWVDFCMFALVIYVLREKCVEGAGGLGFDVCGHSMEVALVIGGGCLHIRWMHVA